MVIIMWIHLNFCLLTGKVGAIFCSISYWCLFVIYIAGFVRRQEAPAGSPGELLFRGWPAYHTPRKISL